MLMALYEPFWIDQFRNACRSLLKLAKSVGRDTLVQGVAVSIPASRAVVVRFMPIKVDKQEGRTT